jgi:hypothetical protein
MPVRSGQAGRPGPEQLGRHLTDTLICRHPVGHGSACQSGALPLDLMTWSNVCAITAGVQYIKSGSL